jgi:AcrR family transcriptional regulator
MPAVPQTSPAEERSHEILFSIREAFAEKGFDGASMQDLARAAGMSVGNFYRYFPSKAAIVQSMCSLDLAEIEAEFGEILGSNDPMAGLRTKILSKMRDDCGGDGRLWAEITAASIRNPDIQAASLHMETAIVNHLNAIFALVTGRPLSEAEQRYDGHSQLLVMLVKAVAVRSSEFGAANAALAGKIVQIIDQVLTEVSSDTAKG